MSTCSGYASSPPRRWRVAPCSSWRGTSRFSLLGGGTPFSPWRYTSAFASSPWRGTYHLSSEVHVHLHHHLNTFISVGALAPTSKRLGAGHPWDWNSAAWRRERCPTCWASCPAPCNARRRRRQMNQGWRSRDEKRSASLDSHIRSLPRGRSLQNQSFWVCHPLPPWLPAATFRETKVTTCNLHGGEGYP